MRETWTFHSAGQLLFGPNASRQLGDVTARLRVRRLLLVTDAVLLRAASRSSPAASPSRRCGRPTPAAR